MLAFKFNQARDAFGTLLGRFHFSRSGSIPVAFALSLVPLLGMVGASIDYTNALQRRRQIQDAADAGVLAAAIQLSNSASVTVTNVNNAKQLVDRL